MLEAKVKAEAIPVIKSHTSYHEWKIFYYEEFENLLVPLSHLDPILVDLIGFSQSYPMGYRREIVIKEFPFLCAVFPQDKEIFIGTRRLSRELCLLKYLQTKSIQEETEPHFQNSLNNIKNHVEKISSLNPSDFPSEIEWVSFHQGLPLFWQKDSWKDIDDEAKIIFKSLHKKTSEYRSSLFEKFSDYGLTLTAQFDLIRVHLLKFLALLPSLDHDKSGKEVKRNLLESLRRLNFDVEIISKSSRSGLKHLPWYLVQVFKLSYYLALPIPPSVLAYVVRYLVRLMAKRFIAGESISTSDKTLKDLSLTSRDATLDQLGELVVSAREADEYFEKVLQLIHGLKKHIPKGAKNSAGIYRAHVSIKVSALSHDFKPQAFDETFAKVAPRLKRILQEAHREQVFINIDAEHYHYRDLVFKIYSKVLLESQDLFDYSQTGIVVQAYLRDGAQHLQDVIELAKKRKLLMPIRLVKGAYWDAETIEGAAHQFSPPQFLNKEESDLHFRQLSYMALKHGDCIQLAIASHNLLDHSFVEALRNKRFPSSPMIEHQCLHMTYEALSHGLAKMNWPTRNYMPIGNLLVGMAYLVRRIMENSSQVGVLSIMRSHKSSTLIGPVEVLLKNKEQKKIVQDSFISEIKSDFTPARPLRLFLEDERNNLFNSLESLKTKILSKQEEWKNSSLTRVICSSDPNLIVGVYKENTLSEAAQLVDQLENGLKSNFWSTNTLARVSIMLKAADLMLIRRNDLAALIIYEAGKTMTEALADVDEAIDFINFYARQEIDLNLKNNQIQNRGVISVIAPWNFPLAIPCGMVVAPLVAGNAVVLKPAEQTPLIAEELASLLWDAGVPKEIFAILQGDGEVVGAPIVTHHRTAGIVFTGSKNVGQWIFKNASDKLITHYKTEKWMQKKVITEMGGKNAIIVTNNCELDETVSGILYAAFGHAGQKCSAASRIIVHSEVKDALVARLIQAMRDIKVGEAMDPSTTVNPLISKEDQDRVRKIVEEAKNEAIKEKGKIHLDRSFEKLPGFCVGPVLLELPLHQAQNKDSWAQREIFGPVIHIVEYDSLIQAVELFNATEYALTGGIYSQSQDDIDFLLKFLRAGNLYVNRPNTGARVAIEPFGGFKMSGTGPKAGGRGYVEQFHFVDSEDAMTPASPVKWADNTGYEIPTPRPSVISTQGRVARLETFSKEFLKDFEKIMGVLSENEKIKIQQYSLWLKENIENFIQGKHPNYVIPGQLSYMDKSLIRESGLFVMINSRPTLKCLQYLFTAVSLGNGLSIICLTEESYQIWREILQMIYKSGFSKANFDLTKIDENSLNSYLSKSQYSFIYLDRFVEFKNTVYRELFPGNALKDHMRLIMSEVDGIDMSDFNSVIDQFVWMRALAINTMRHGAPLEINS